MRAPTEPHGGRHGAVGTYTWGRCRCAECRRAATLYRRRYPRHTPGPVLCLFCDYTFASVHSQRIHETRIHTRPVDSQGSDDNHARVGS